MMHLALLLSMIHMIVSRGGNSVFVLVNNQLSIETMVHRELSEPHLE